MCIELHSGCATTIALLLKSSYLSFYTICSLPLTSLSGSLSLLQLRVNRWLGLWDIVENSEEPSKLKRKNKAQLSEIRKDAAALHAIQVSCGAKELSLIMDKSSAKCAWEALKDKYIDDSVKEKKADVQKYAPLHKAVRDGKLEEVLKFLEAHPEEVNAKETALQLAVIFEHLRIVEVLVNMMQEGALAEQTQFGQTALAIAASSGIIEMAKCMIEKNRNLPKIPTDQGLLPVTLAVISNKKEMARYLYSVTPWEELVLKKEDPLPKKEDRGDPGANLILQCIISEDFELIVHLLGHYPRLAITLNEDNYTFLWSLATNPSLFPSSCKLVFWNHWIYNWIQIEFANVTKDVRLNIERSNARESNDKMSKVPNKYYGLLRQLVVCIFNLTGIKRIYKLKLTHVTFLELLRITCNEITEVNDLSQLSNAKEFQSLFKAAECGNPEFIIELLKVIPDIRLDVNEQGRNFFFLAIQYRQAKVFSLIYGVNSATRDDLANVVDKSGNTALHMAALLASSEQLNNIPGAALQMQRELQWFKEVEHVMTPSKRNSANDDDMTARELFTKQHKDLRKEGEDWMKHNATSCTLAAALIVTIMFAASFTVPGGNDQNTGYPMFRDRKLFKLFIIADAISLFSSTTSLLMFLGILTSRYAEDDFLKSLPTKLIIGLSMMFISIATMMISFTTAILIMLPEKSWVNILVILFACVPISSFVWLQFPLLIEVYLYTYGRGIFERNMERWF